MELNELVEKIHKNAKDKGFWNPLSVWEELRANIENKLFLNIGPEYQGFLRKLINEHEKHFFNYAKAARIMLIVTELAEAIEADRHGDFENFKEEIADSIIRTLDLCGSLDINIDDEIRWKTKYNEKRPPLHGKAY